MINSVVAGVPPAFDWKAQPTRLPLQLIDLARTPLLD
jgi:hypothetical protein